MQSTQNIKHMTQGRIQDVEKGKGCIKVHAAIFKILLINIHYNRYISYNILAIQIVGWTLRKCAPFLYSTYVSEVSMR